MNKTKRISLISLYCALAIVFDYIKSFIPFLNMPSGGSINIALIPIVICSFHLGVLDGILTGILWWLISSVLGLNPYYLNIFQYIVDYILPSAIIGICSLFYKKKNIYEVESGIVFMMLCRTFLLVLSGALFWPDDVAANSLAAWSASLVYNLPYSIATMIMLVIIIPIVLKSLKRYML